MRYCIPFIFLLLLISSCTPDHPTEQRGWGVWEFRSVGESEWHNAEVPGTIQTDLMQNGLIDDPFYGENEKGLQWIGESEWEYRSIFFVDTWIMEKENVELVFEGLDTYAKVFLNGELILEADNMFRTWEADIKELLLDGKNELLVIFLPPGEITDAKASELPYKLPDIRGFTRKSPYHFGWDWGPVFVTCGIWKPVYLKAWNDFRIENIHIKHAPVGMDPLPVEVHLTIESSGDQSAGIEVVDAKTGETIASKEVSLKTGENKYILRAQINDPDLWWPVGLGDQDLYTFRARVSAGETTDEKNATFGIREIELIREPDEDGESFYFRVNGFAVFMKGANYVPQDNFLPRVDTSRYEKLINSVVDANMNMLRVWGGGFYENDHFYDLCDEHGILVWQDFMFACNMYPGDEAFLENVKQEAVDNVKRLSNHPSIALWCGNNEIDEGWHNWGWQQALGYSEEDSSKVWNDYLKVFHGILPEVVEQYDPGTIYWPSSPMTGWGRDEAYTQGDVHYWGVWWGEYPFRMYKEKVGRFVSEYGFQGMPPMETIESFGGVMHPTSNTQYPTSGVLEAHQKHPRGTELIQKYMERDYIVPEKFEDYVYVSQVLQAEGMAQAFLTHRISQPHCMGTLYWQLNDCWPVTSWSGLDYYGRWKALHYHVKRAYEPLMVSVRKIGGINEVYIVNDFPYEVNVDFAMETYTLERRKKVQRNDRIRIPALSVIRAGTFPDPNENGSSLLNFIFISREDSVLSRSFTYFVPTKDINLPDPRLSWEISGNVITIRTENLARQVFLEARGLEGRFSDNFFDMAPGETREIMYMGTDGGQKLFDRLKIKSIYGTYN